jgi:Trk K+ transport system NAD-binding subunit
VLAYLERYRDAMEVGPAAGAPRAAEALPREALPVVREVAVEADALVDQPLRALRLRERFGILVVTITRADGEVLHHLTADTVLRRGDRARIFGLPGQIEAFVGGLAEAPAEAAPAPLAEERAPGR